ncbi:hypothetical protein [Phytohabitans houttuyneae]|uniref:Uncharacterized protein n=1 Tax=Phytohabitans houttuyneae TaxID=1076126 RepID=A0A6V8JYH8_9ACTN|nr:hypothetical protein [Phytohabitans houttuyneae]GFJ76350.1 hypothetical protein Phou_005300 [Phytohabitans houttuyneae]
MTDKPMLRAGRRCANPTVTRSRHDALDWQYGEAAPPAPPVETPVKPALAWNMLVLDGPGSDGGETGKIAVVGICALWPAAMVVPLA